MSKMQNDKTKAVEVFRGTMMEAAIVKSLLENAEVEAFLKDEFLTPWNDASGWQNAVKIIVSSEDIEQAKIVVDEYLKNYNSAPEPDSE